MDFIQSQSTDQIVKTGDFKRYRKGFKDGNTYTDDVAIGLLVYKSGRIRLVNRQTNQWFDLVWRQPRQAPAPQSVPQAPIVPPQNAPFAQQGDYGLPGNNVPF